MESEGFAHIRARCIRFLYEQKGRTVPMPSSAKAG
jgi:hypothetical protein